MKFLCLAYEEERLFHEMPHSEWLALRDESLAYVEKLREEGRLVDTRPLRSASTAATLRIRESKLQVTDGPYAETKEQIGGFFLIEADSFKEALEIAAGWPSARIGAIEVRPLEEGLRTDKRY